MSLIYRSVKANYVISKTPSAPDASHFDMDHAFLLPIERLEIPLSVSLRSMKVAYVHDWLIVSGGAEKVAHEILKIWDADVFSLIDLLNDEDRDFILHGKHATTSFIQNMPMLRQKYRFYLPFFPKAIEKLNVMGYELVFSSSYAVAKGVKTGKDQLHICYCHTPMRYAWDLQEEYLHSAGLSSGIKGSVLRSMLGNLRDWDKRTVDRVDHFIANSDNTAERIKRNYERSSTVIHPPVDMNAFPLRREKGKYFVTIARLVPYKRMDLIVKAFNNMPDKKLLLIGEGPELPVLQSMAKENIEFLGHLSQGELVDKIGSAKAIVLVAHEDLGLTSLEAQSCGTPVIAYKKGGYLETVQDGMNGVFFTEQSAEAIQKAVVQFENNGVEWTAEQIRKSVLPFSSEEFRRKIELFVGEKLKAHNV